MAHIKCHKVVFYMADSMRMAKITALQLAKYIVSFAQSKGEPITNLKLQKLLYYAQGWHLAFFGSTLFDESIQAWVHGPVVPSVYAHFKGYGYNPIPVHPRAIVLTKELENFLSELLLTYLRFDAFSLEKMTHEEKPWQEARGSIPPEESCTNVISLDTMKKFFKKKL